MQTMTETLMAFPLQDDALARRLLQRAQGAFQKSRMCKNWGYAVLEKVHDQESSEEMQHADKLIQRMLFLEGVPNLSDYDPILVGRTVREQIDNDLALEMGALAVLRPGIELCVEAGDYATRELLERILKDEEHHVDWLETQKHTINEVGCEGYLAQQIYHRD